MEEPKGAAQNILQETKKQASSSVEIVVSIVRHTLPSATNLTYRPGQMWNDNGDGNDGNGGNGGNDVNGGNDGNCTYPTFCLLRGVMIVKRGDDILAARSSLTHCHLLTDQLLFKTLPRLNPSSPASSSSTTIIIISQISIIT